MSDEELAEAQRSCEALIGKYGHPEDYPFSQAMVRAEREKLRFVIEARTSRKESHGLRAERAALIGTVKQFLRDEYPMGAAGASPFVQRLEATLRMVETKGQRTMHDLWRFLRERSGACS